MKKILLASFFVALFFSAWAQERTVTGKVTSAEDGSGLPGVNVLLKNTATGTVTDGTGSYSINVPQAGGTLVFTFIGLVSQEIEIGTRSVIDVSMASDVTQLTEVVVTALGIKREEKSLGYAVQEVKGDQLTTVKSDNFLNSLSGKVAGLQVKNNTNFGGGMNVLIRGSSSLTKNNQPLYVIDGVPISNYNANNSGQTTGRQGYDYGTAVSDIDPNNIESLSVLKGSAATALYGSRAANGVILITTKKGSKSGKGVGVSFSSNVTFSKVDKKTIPDYQKEYGAGYGPYYSGGDYPYLEEVDVDGDGTDDLLAPTYEDASRGQKFDPNLMVWQYNAFYPESKHYGSPTPWVAGAHGPDTFFETAKSYTNSVDISNASENGSYRLGYTNSDLAYVMPNSSIKRNNFILNGSYNILKNLKVTASANYINTKGKGRPSTGYSDNIMSSFRQWYQMNVDIQEQKDLFFNSGKNLTWNPAYYTDLVPIYWDNPYWVRYKNYETDERNRIIGYAQLDYDVTPFLSIQGRASIDTYDQLNEERKAVGSGSGEFGVDRPDITSGYSRYTQTWREHNLDLMLNFHKALGDNLDLTAFLATNIRRSRNETYYASTSGGLSVPDIYALSNSKDPMLPPEELLQEIGVNGYIGSVSLGYRDFLYLDASIRRDQSSTLPESNNTYYYPSVSTSFVFSELMESPTLSLGKLRLNYAEVGNDVTPLSVIDTYRINAPFDGNSLTTVFDSKNNPNLKPERARTIEAGLQLNFLQNRLGLDVAVYKKNTFDQSIPLYVSQATGYWRKWINAGEMENKGIELALFATPVNLSNGFRWDINVNWAANRNKVVKLYTDETGNKVTNLELASLQGGVHIVAREGQPYGAITGTDYVYHDNGGRLINPANGRYRISSTNDNVIGNVNPDWIGGVMNSISYKNFTFSFLIDVQHGGDVFSLDLWYGMGTGLYKETAGLNDLGNPVRDPVLRNDDGTYDPATGGILNEGVYDDGSPNTRRVAADRYTADGWAVSPNARFVYDASYVKLRSVSLTYNLPKALLAKTPIQGASIAFVGSNVWIISKNLPHADPEATLGAGNIQGWQSGVAPMTNNYGFTLNVKF
ncbi:MAG TPA: SusC/RagA family TonB-linked outer membrane protein [Cyclobacteriaceae bacterium]|nr:SusC/RagA family TonB-linked outer membrane protein [Cyclobacteriaceae bacterium]